jgi:uncharacterized protein YecT (DUF1311 family)
MRASLIRRLWLYTICLCAALFAMPAAHAATVTPSFDCAHAPGVDERLICADPLLRQADHDLGQAYNAARNANAGASYRAALRADEHGWILQRDAECQITKFTIVTDGSRPGLTDCLLDQYAERSDDLAQMRLRPQTAPGDISHPIRRSFIAATAGEAGGTAQSFSSLQLPAGSTGTPLLAWRNDGSVALFDTGADGSGILSIWSGGALHRLAQIPQGAQYNQLCALPDGSLLLLGSANSWIGADGKSKNVAGLSARQLCGTVLELGDGAGTTLQYGAPKQGVTPAPRFVTVTTSTGTVTTPIRIDSRFALSAAYLPSADAFLLNRNVSPASLEAAVERRWSKSNCLAYWTIAAKTGAVKQSCIPFGAYVNSVLTALPTHAGVYLAASGDGLFRISNGEAQLVMPGLISQAAISADGCSLAFALAQGAQSSGAMIVLNACGAKPTSAATGTP